MFLTDFRYETQSAAAGVERLPAPDRRGRADRCRRRGARRGGRTRRLRRVGAHGGRAPPAARAARRVVGARRVRRAIVAGLRLVKDAGEIALIRARRRTSPTRRCARSSKTGSPAAPSARWRSSSSCACAGSGAEASELRLDRRRRRRTARCRTPSRGREEIAADALVTIDWGALLDGYCSDCTRTYATARGSPTEEREVYALVLEAQLRRAARRVRPGPSGREVDAAAREVHRSGRPRRALRPRPRSRGRPRGARGPAPRRAPPARSRCARAAS